MTYNWNWLIFFEDSPDRTGTYLQTLLGGLGWTINVSLAAGIMAMVLGLVIGILRTVPNVWIVRFANAYVELFRNIPLLVQMFLWYFVVPELLPTEAGNWIKTLKYSSFFTSVIALGFYTSARIAVQVSAGIKTLPRAQSMAALALGLTHAQTYRYVLVPVSLRLIMPPLTSEFLGVIKNSAVALTIGLMELTARTRAMTEYSFQTFEAFTAATLIYIVLNIIVVALMRLLERSVEIPGTSASHNNARQGAEHG